MMHVGRPFSPFLALVVSVAFLVVAGLRAAPPENPTKSDEGLLKNAHHETDDKSLLGFLNDKIPDDSNRDQIAALIRKLGADAFATREKASAELVKYGGKATTQLQQATKSDDIEVVRRAEECLRDIDKTWGRSVTMAAVRLLAARKPAGTTAMLLKFAPFADDESVLDTLRDTLAALAAPAGKPDVELTAALKDKTALRRELAGEALVRAGQSAAVPVLRELLNDPEPKVRLRVGMAFVDRKDKEPLPRLIDLLAELPRQDTAPVEEVLNLIARDKSPKVALGDSEDSRKKCRDAWKEWWDKNGAKVDLTKVDLSQRMLGYTLLVVHDQFTGVARVMELDRHNKERWRIEGLLGVTDAQIIGHDRVLVAESQGQKVTERNFKGEVLWEKKVTGWPQSAERLANGNTIIFSNNQILEVDEKGKEVFNIGRPAQDILSGKKLKDGTILIATNTGRALQLDSAGKELKSTPINVAGHIAGSNIELTPEGNYLVPNFQRNCVEEVEPGSGKSIRQIRATRPTSVQRLPNGHLLVGSFYSQRAFEMDGEGKSVWDIGGMGQIYRVRRR